MTLAPVVRHKAITASQEDKEWLAGALYHLREPTTGSLEGDILKLSEKIDQCVSCCVLSHVGSDRAGSADL